MKDLKYYFTSIALLIVISNCGAQVNYNTIINDFDKFYGSWTGSLTYLDYSSGKPYTMPAELKVKRIHNTNQFTFSFKYPNESSANSLDTIIISLDGRNLNKESIKSRQKLKNGNIEIITVEVGQDGNDDQQATLKYSYIFGKTTFSIVKDVQFSGETKWIKRHTYSFAKIPSLSN